ncbi:MAG: hypothetical protein MJY44_01955 [Bacteroidales bacterium]|nr:hypothetical protein [Bacteroidales bacterium]
MEKFDYKKAVARLEQIALKVEDPATGLDPRGKEGGEAENLLDGCRTYLRKVREDSLRLE